MAVDEDGMMARRDPFLYEVEGNRSSAGENGEWRMETEDNGEANKARRRRFASADI